MLGKNVSCRITGFTGLATAVCTYFDGAVMVQVTPAGDAESAQWIAQRRLQLHGETPPEFAAAATTKKKKR